MQLQALPILPRHGRIGKRERLGPPSPRSIRRDDGDQHLSARSDGLIVVFPMNTACDAFEDFLLRFLRAVNAYTSGRTPICFRGIRSPFNRPSPFGEPSWDFAAIGVPLALRTLEGFFEG